MVLPRYPLPEGIEKVFNAQASRPRTAMLRNVREQDLHWRARADQTLMYDDTMDIRESGPLLGFLRDGDQCYEKEEIDNIVKAVKSPAALASAEEIFKANLFLARLNRIEMLDKRDEKYDEAAFNASCECLIYDPSRNYMRAPGLQRPYRDWFRRLKNEYDPTFFEEFNGRQLEYIHNLRDASAQLHKKKNFPGLC